MRAQDAAVQVAGIRPAFRLDACRHLQHFQPPAPSDFPPHPALLPGAGQGRLECCSSCGVRVAENSGPLRAGQVPVTMPTRRCRRSGRWRVGSRRPLRRLGLLLRRPVVFLSGRCRSGLRGGRLRPAPWPVAGLGQRRQKIYTHRGYFLVSHFSSSLIQPYRTIVQS